MTGPEPLVLIVEDDAQLRRFLRVSLSSRGYRLEEATTVREAEQLATSLVPDLFLLDLGLPDGDGIELTRSLRGWTRAPIIVISARGREEDKVHALDVGADDYLTKPFGLNELLARIRVALRHAEGVTVDAPVLTAGPLTIDLARRDVAVAGREIRLTPLEFKLLALLARNAGKVLTHGHILKEIWGPHSTQAHVVRVHMAELRRKIESDPARPRLIVTEVGVGYRLKDD